MMEAEPQIQNEPQNSNVEEPSKIGSKAVPHIILLFGHILRPVIDIYIGITLWRNKLPLDWYGLTFFFVVLPQILRILVLFFSHLPSFKLIKNNWKSPMTIWK